VKLKERILENGEWRREKTDLKGVDATRLTLHQVELLDGKTVGHLAAQAVKGKGQLLPYSRLFKVFPTGPPEDSSLDE